MTSTNKRDGGEVESDPLDRRLLGRARFLRDRGEIKSPELMEEAERALAESRAECERLVEAYRNAFTRADRLEATCRWVITNPGAHPNNVRSVLRAALEQEPQE